jgi:hypothetical protein
MNRRSLPVLFSTALLALASSALGQGAAAAGQAKAAPHAAAHVLLNPSDMKWGDAPPIFAPGAKMAVLQGDPSKAGVYTVRLKAGDGYQIAAHWHPTTENITVISGVFNVGAGDKLDMAGTTAIVAGGFASMPARMHHYAWFKGETEVQVHGVGPFKLTYVDPKNDPTKKK